MALRGTKRAIMDEGKNKGEAGSLELVQDGLTVGLEASATTSSSSKMTSNYFGLQICILFRLHISSSCPASTATILSLNLFLSSTSCSRSWADYEQRNKLSRRSRATSILPGQTSPLLSLLLGGDLAQDGWRGFASSVGVWQNDRRLARRREPGYFTGWAGIYER